MFIGLHQTILTLSRKGRKEVNLNIMTIVMVCCSDTRSIASAE